MTLDELKSQLSRFGIRPNKLLGQNFLLSEEVLEQIVAAADLTAQDTVLEIGPGLGVLTRRLGEKAGLVLAIEKDHKLVRVLRKLFKSKKNIKIIQGDVLDLRTDELMNERTKEQDPQFIGSSVHSFFGFKVVANIPYYLTGKLLQNFLTPSSSPPYQGGEREGVDARPSLMVLLLQKEVAERIVAEPGEMSLLSVSAQFYSEPEIIGFVKKENFYPVPEVDSAIVKFKVLTKPRFTPSLNPSPRAGEGRERGVDEKKFFQLVKIGFAGRRKQLQNNLTAGFGTAVTPEKSGVHKIRLDYKILLSSLDLNPLCRAQDLSLEDWARLYEKLHFS